MLACRLENLQGRRSSFFRYAGLVPRGRESACMRETTRSLGAWFVLCGACSVLLGVFQMVGLARVFVNGPFQIYWLGIYICSTLVSVAMVLVGVKLKWMLSTRPQLPLRLGKQSMVLSFLSLNWPGALFNFYILVQLRRLAREAQIVPEQRVLS